MLQRQELWMALMVAAALPATAQDTQWNTRPEVDLYVAQGSRSRVLFQYLLNNDRQDHTSKGIFASYFELALRPVFRRELRQQDDVFRRRFLTFRAGFQYTTSFDSGNAASEKRPIAELTAKYPLPGGFVLTDRNRGDFRFVIGQPFSARYRNRLWLDRDFKFRQLVFTPYVYDEVFFDTRYNAWSTNRVAVGLQVPAGEHLVVEPYVMRQVASRSTPRVSETLGLKFSFYF